MDLLKMLGVAVAASILCLVLRRVKPEMAVVCALAAGVILLLMMSGRLASIIDSLTRIAETAGLNSGSFELVIRVIGVAYLVEFAAHACRDAEESSLAAKVEMVGRISIMAMSLPLLVTILDTVTAMIP